MVSGGAPESVLQVLERRNLEAAAPSWDALVDAQARPNPFLRSWWLDHAHGGDPVLQLVYEGEELIGGLALERVPGHPMHLVTLGAELCPDHVDLIAVPGREAEVTATIGAWLRRPGVLRDAPGFVGVERLSTTEAQDAREHQPAPRSFRRRLRAAHARRDEETSARDHAEDARPSRTIRRGDVTSRCRCTAQ